MEKQKPNGRQSARRVSRSSRERHNAHSKICIKLDMANQAILKLVGLNKTRSPDNSVDPAHIQSHAESLAIADRV